MKRREEKIEREGETSTEVSGEEINVKRNAKSEVNTVKRDKYMVKLSITKEDIKQKLEKDGEIRDIKKIWLKDRQRET